jgi:hypothetical protein
MVRPGHREYQTCPLSSPPCKADRHIAGAKKNNAAAGRLFAAPCTERTRRGKPRMGCGYQGAASHITQMLEPQQLQRVLNEVKSTNL